MIEDLADLWSFDAATCDARCITTNGTIKSSGRGVMGRGCAHQAKMRYLGLEIILGHALQGWGNIPCILLPDQRPVLVSFPVKHEWHERADLELIAESTRQLVKLAKNEGWRRIVLPRPGCGNGGLKWESQVRPILQPLLDDRFRVVTL